MTTKMTSKTGRKKSRSSRNRGVEVECAFCGGRGRDPFGIMSALATCQVCGGTGKRRLRKPMAGCAFCQGTGVFPGSRMTCTTCGGIGQVEIPQDAVVCPWCGGSGHADTLDERPSNFSCMHCGGKGMVPKGIPGPRKSELTRTA